MDGNTFGFIVPKLLRNNVIESVNFAAFLWVLAQRVESEYQDEMVRTIVLYNIGIIEALLLFRAKRQKLNFYDCLYPHATVLPPAFQQTPSELIVSFRRKQKRHDSRVWLNDLIKEQKTFLGESLHKRVTDLQNIRNTFHLSRPRNILSPRKAEESFDIVFELTAKVRKETIKR